MYKAFSAFHLTGPYVEYGECYDRQYHDRQYHSDSNLVIVDVIREYNNGSAKSMILL